MREVRRPACVVMYDNGWLLFGVIFRVLRFTMPVHAESQSCCTTCSLEHTCR